MPSEYFLKERRRKEERKKIGKNEKEDGKQRGRDKLTTFAIVVLS